MQGVDRCRGACRVYVRLGREGVVYEGRQVGRRLDGCR